MKKLSNYQLALEVKNLNYSIDKKPLLNDVSIKIPVGSFTLLSGRNGSGKTLLMRIIKGLIQADSGSILINNVDVSKNKKKRNELIGYVFQDADTQLVGQTVERDIYFGMENIALPKDEIQKRFEYAIKLLELEKVLKQRPRSLSGGEKRKLAIAGVLVMNPQIIILDEPFANLDYPAVVQVLKALTTLQKEGSTIIVATHEIEKVAFHADSMIILENGEVVLQDQCEKALERVGEFGIRRPVANSKPIVLEDLTWLK